MNQGSLEKLLLQGLGQGMNKMEHVTVPVGKGVPINPTAVGYVKGTQESTERAPNAKAGTI